MKSVDGARRAAGVASSDELRRWKRHFAAHRDRLIAATAADTGRDVNETFLVEWGPVESALAFLEENVDDALGPRALRSSFRALLGSRSLTQRRLPLGHVLIVGTWNFPLALHLVQILFARAAGNRVTFKPSPQTPAFSVALAEATADLWGGEMTVAPAEPAGDVLARVRAREFDQVLFTGGTAGARVFASACADALVPFVAEASGSESAIVVGTRSSQDVSDDVDHLLWALLHHAGQTCVAPRFWFVPRALARQYFALATQYLDETNEISTSRAPLKNAAVAAEHEAWCGWVRAQDVEREHAAAGRPDFKVFLARDLARFNSDSPPTFGPAAVLVPYDSLGEVVAWTRRSPWSLMTTVLGEASATEAAALERLDASIVAINEAVSSVGDAAVPFGGRGLSGFGVTHGVEGLHQLSRSQTFVEVRSWPGLAALRPSWRRLLKLNRAGTWLKELDTNPLSAVTQRARNLITGEWRIQK